MLTPCGTIAIDAGTEWESARTTAVRAFDQDEKVRGLSLDNHDDGARYAITDAGDLAPKSHGCDPVISGSPVIDTTAMP